MRLVPDGADGRRHPARTGRAGQQALAVPDPCAADGVGAPAPSSTKSASRRKRAVSGAVRVAAAARRLPALTACALLAAVWAPALVGIAGRGPWELGLDSIVSVWIIGLAWRWRQ